MQFPAIIGGVVPVTNLDAVKPGELKLTGPVLADIFLGKIRTWNDKAIADLNPASSWKARSLWCAAPTARARLCLLTTSRCRRWKSKGGRRHRRRVAGRRGQQGATRVWRSTCSASKGAIGCGIRLRQEEQTRPHSALKNRDGQFVQPEEASFAAASADCRLEEHTGHKV